MTVIVQVLDDSGNVEGTLELPEIDLKEFEEQLPQGWYVDVLVDYGDES